jgi:tRNA nucleotidyltransferase (CCA-adding enzyme)
VGGIVRDLFLRMENLDVDIVVEGDGIVFAGMIVRKLGGRMRTHQKFGTAVVVLPGGVKLDIATARLEYYETPAALPTVELSSIKKDLYRRDFTINTLAVRLNRDRFGELIDFFGGLRDIKERTIRILHNLSFVEDPTRVFRAIRFEQRFDFPIGKHTRNLIRSAVNLKLFNKLSGERIYDELVLMFSELDPLKVLRRMEELDLLKFLHPNLRFGAELERLFAGISETLTWYRLLYLEVPVERWFVYFLGLLDRLKDEAAQEALERLAVPPRVRKRVMASRLHCRDILFEFYRDARLPASRVYDLLHPLDIEQVLVMMAKARKEPAKRYISLYLTRLRNVNVSLTGDDLKRMGLPPGPRYKKILAGLLDAKLDGAVTTKEDEVAYVKRVIGRR